MTITFPEHPGILIVSDTPSNIDLLVRVLEGDYELRFATSEGQALALLATPVKPELILLDVLMPETGGHELCRALKRDHGTRDIPVILLTAKADAESEVAALAAGAADFIHKPINVEVLRARIRLLIEAERRATALKISLAEVKANQVRLQVFSTAIEQGPTSVIITGPDATIQYVNPQFTRQTGYALAEVIGQNPRILNSGLTDPARFEEMWSHLVRGDSWVGEVINRRKSGEIFWEEIHISAVKDDSGKTTHYVAVKLNIDERKEATERLARMANHDPLTDLPNRMLFFELVSQALAQSRRNAGKLALMFIDLDNFKRINDTCGHAVGDLVLQKVAQRLRDCLRASDVVGRIGGDEFVVLLPEIRDQEDSIAVAEKIRQALTQAAITPDKAHSISPSIGIAIFPDHGADEIELSRNADFAMYRAKEAGGNRLQVFNVSMTEPAMS